MKIKAKCRICGTEAEHETYEAKEMFFGSGEKFIYFKCNVCQCLQIKDIPEDLGKYYGIGYYSLGQLDVPDVITTERIDTRILDVGCGSGKWLLEKYSQGHVNLFGCDPYIAEDIQYRQHIKIKKCTIHDLFGTYDLIRLGDSFEHMTDPHEVLRSVYRLLDDEGICLISMPIFPNAAYDIFGSCWFEWDAPRHIFLYSIKSMEYMCQRSGLIIENINFNSQDKQFISSLLYQKGIPYIAHDDKTIKDYFTADDLEQFRKYSAELNEKGYGDHAVLVLKKQNLNKKTCNKI